MTARPAHNRRTALPLAASLLVALAVGVALVVARPLAGTAPAPAPTVAPRLAAATSVPTATPPATASAPATTTPAATSAPAEPTTSAQPAAAQPTLGAPPRPAALATPAGPAWIEIGRWRDHQLLFTEEFTVRGPWRIRWQLSGPTEPFNMMIEEGVATTPRLFTFPTGQLTGQIDEPRGGTFNLMLHNTIPYEVIVEELRPPAP